MGDAEFATGLQRLIGGSVGMRALRRCVSKLADVPTTVLLAGETGTGKTTVACALHEESQRRAEPFVVVDCGALAPTLMESELFGFERGAFTGAEERRSGLLERARAGTLLLDEISELPLPLQPKLLRVLHERSYERLGGSRSLAFHARIVAASNRDLADEVERGTFRRDLYYRVGVVRLSVPPLRTRLDDLPGLFESFAREICRHLGRPPPVLAPETLDVLRAHDWPGNLRELRNVIERMVVMDEAAPQIPGRANRPAPEHQRLARALADADGNVARAARRLGLPRTTFRRRLDRFGLSGAGAAPEESA
jgi:two-component system response regulator AtoC